MYQYLRLNNTYLFRGKWLRFVEASENIFKFKDTNNNNVFMGKRKVKQLLFVGES